jgi:AraC-like DNA-binding protein
LLAHAPTDRRAIRPRQVRLAHPPYAAQEHKRIFGCTVRFGASRAEMVLDAADLALTIRCAKPGLVEVLDRYACDLLSHLPSTGASYVDRVRHHVTKSIRHGAPTLQAVSRAMRASPRTVQRRLREAGTSHRRVLEEVRRDLAMRYLASPELSITEIAYLLRFEEESGFRRSFKRWKEQNPAAARKRQREK